MAGTLSYRLPAGSVETYAVFQDGSACLLAARSYDIRKGELILDHVAILDTARAEDRPPC